MNKEMLKHKNYWDMESEQFDSIYSHKKNICENFLDSVFRWDMYKRFDYTMENAGVIPNRTFLDVGCGTGLYSLEFARRNASKVIGIDVSEQMIKRCQQRALEENVHDKCSFFQTDLLEYQPDTKFDVCIGIGLFDYVKEPLPVLTKMRNCVNDRVIISFPRFWTWRAPVRKLRLALKRYEVYFYKMRYVDGLVKQAGFTRYNVQKIGQLYCVTAFTE